MQYISLKIHKEEAVFTPRVETKRTMKTFVRILSLLLAVLMLGAVAFTFVACDEEPDNGGATGGTGGSGSGSGSGVIDSKYDKNGLLMDELGNSHNYGNEMVYVLCWNDGYGTEFKQDDITGVSHIDAVYERNEEIKSRLNVDLDFDERNGSNPKRAEFVSHVEKVYQNGGVNIDIIAAYTRTAGMLAQRGYLKDLKNLGLEAAGRTNWINFDMPWWPDNVMDVLSFSNSCFFITGDISTSVPYMMTGIFFNKKMFNQYYNTEAQQAGFANGVEMLYDKVSSKNWTLDELIKYSSVYTDTTGNGKTEDDTYGFATHLVHVDGFYTGAELRLVDTDPVTKLKISADYGSRKTVRLIDQLGDWLTADCNYSERYDGEFGRDQAGGVSGHMVPFIEGRCMFLMARTYVAEQVLSKKAKTFQYGIVPIPMYKNQWYNQNNYYSVIGNPVSLYGIFVNAFTGRNARDESHDTEAEHIEMLTAVLECWGSEGYRKTTPEIFYVNFMTRYADSPDDALMFQYVRNAVTFDLGRIFADALSSMSELPSHCAMSGSSWSISYGQYKTKLQNQMDDLIEDFTGLIG